MHLRRVLLPAPEGPMITLVSPLFTAKEAHLRISTFPKDLWMSSTTKTGVELIEILFSFQIQGYKLFFLPTG